MWVVLADDAYDPAAHHDFPPRLGDLLFTEEAPQNGPAGGTYLMSAHDAPTGPHLVDWYLQPLRVARRSESRVVLVDRTTFPAAPEEAAPNAGFAGTPEEDAASQAALFWAMVLVQAKWIARRPTEEGLGFEGFILSLLRNVAAWQGVAPEEAETGVHRDVVERLDRLSDLGRSMAEIAPALCAPRPAVERLLETVRTFATET